MPSGMIPIKEIAPYRGMNTYDDPKVLQDGECVDLCNALPGRPPRPRNGCQGSVLADSATMRFIPPGIAYNVGADVYIIAWVYDSSVSEYKLILFSVDTTGAYTVLGNASIDSTPVFGMQNQHSCIYTISNQPMSLWKGGTESLSHKVVEGVDVVREMCISEAASIQALTVTGDDATGVFDVGDCFDYAFTYIRHVTPECFEDGSSPAGMIFHPDVSEVYTSPQPKRIDAFTNPGACEGVELVSNREAINISDDGEHSKYYTNIDLSNDHGTAIAQGATHLRVTRSRRQSSVEDAQGATKFFVCDLPLVASPQVFTDKLSDAALAGETNQLIYGYSVAPQASYIEYCKERMWLFSQNGKGYYSEAPGNDGATDDELAKRYPQKWSSFWNPTRFYVDCDSTDGQVATGMKRLGDDLYFFKQKKIFCLYGGDPLSAAPTLVSDNLGCSFPHTITKCEMKGYLGNVILFLSNEGPAVIQEGGRIRLFSEFKIMELWPDRSLDLYGELETDYDWIVNNCSASYFKNNWVILYQKKSGEFRWFNYYVNPGMAIDPSAPRGPWRGEFAEM